MLSRRLAASVAFLVVSSAMAIACNEEGPHPQACYPGDVEYTDASLLPDGASVVAFVRCNGAGTAYEPVDAAPNVADAADEADAQEAGTNCDINVGLLGF